MNRWFTLTVLGLASLLASCGSSVSSSTQPGNFESYSMYVTPDRATLNAGDWTSISAMVEMSYKNGTPKAISPQPTIKFYSSDPRVTVSPAGEVCAGQWDSLYLTCTPTATLPTGYVTITAANESHNVTGSTAISVHTRAASITLSADWGTRKCISQGDRVNYIATAVDSSGNTISNIFTNDYTWTVGDSTVAQVGLYGSAIAVNPGVTNIYAKLNGTVSEPLAFVTCPPASLQLKWTDYNANGPGTSYSTTDLSGLNKGAQKYFTATFADINNNPLTLSSLPLSFISSDTLIASLADVLPQAYKLTANTSGRTTVTAACEPSTCNVSVGDFVLPDKTLVKAKDVGFGYPVYSNVVGVGITGTTSSSVLVTGTTLADGVTPAHRLEVYDSESLTKSTTIALPNLPNSLVVSPRGGVAYLGSSDGLMTVDLTKFQASIQDFSIVGGQATDRITGKVLGVSPNERFVVISDTDNGLVFLADTSLKTATRYTIPGITAATFAPDASNMWIGGSNGVYTYNADTFVRPQSNQSTNVKAMAWVPDGQSYFASGDKLVNYSTCDDKNPQVLSFSPLNLATTAISGVPHVLGLSGSEWVDLTMGSSAQIGSSSPNGNVCLSNVTVAKTTTAPSTLQCSATQVSFAPSLQQEFVTGVDASCGSAESVLHGYDMASQQEITLTASSALIPLSGGALNDGRKLYVGSTDGQGKAYLHRFDLATGSEDSATSTTTSGTTTTTTVTIPATVDLVPSFVAVVPK